MSARSIGRAFGVTVALAGALFVVWTAWNELPRALEHIERIQAGYLSVALVAFMAQGWISAATWARLATARQQPVTIRDAYRAVYAPMLARYLPGGSAWTIAATSAASHEVGVRASVAMLGSTGIVAIAAIGAVAIAAAVAIGVPLAMLAAIVVGVGAAIRVFGGPRTRVAADLALLGALSWIVAGAGHLGIAFALGVDAAVADRVLAAAASGWMAGLAAIGVPAGIGVREAAQTFVLRDAVGGDIAVVIALITRAITIVSDIVASTIAWSLSSRRSDARRASH
ncbi:MAG: hypothetical protein EPO26_04190 [Chloroflexota bacterium]|nr:MAG: hypothetical protein EPO26_04190 [Chloroflexota bacterium]